MKKYFLFAPILLLSLISFVACDSTDDGIIYGKRTDSGWKYQEPKDVASRMEAPAKGRNSVLISHTADGVMTYCMEYDTLKLHSRWVAFRFDGNTRGTGYSRSNAWADDPDLPSLFQIGTDYFSGYQRGHLCASSDRVYSQTANEQTFYMSNMSPMQGNFNSHYWVTLEGAVQKIGRNATFADTLYVVKGGTIKNDQIKGYLSRPNGTRTVIPSYYYMALLKVKNGVYSSIGFWIEHKEYGYNNSTGNAPLTALSAQAVTINELEELTGIDFFPNLPDRQEESIENQKFTSEWGM